MTLELSPVLFLVVSKMGRVAMVVGRDTFVLGTLVGGKNFRDHAGVAKGEDD